MGLIIARFWCQHASIFLQNIHQNLSKNRFQDASLFRSISASISRRTKTTKVGPRRRPRRQDGPKKFPKTVPRGSQKTGAHHQFSGLAAKRPQEASKTAQEAPRSPEYSPKASFSLPKSIKIASKIDLQRHRFFDRFWYGFLDGPRPPKAAIQAPRRSQEAPKHAHTHAHTLPAPFPFFHLNSGGNNPMQG